MASNDYDQMSLFPEEPATDDDQPDPLTKLTPLDDVIGIYAENLRREGSSIHTIKAFRSDLNLLASWAGVERAVGSFGTEDLNRFLHWMLTERDRPCSPKTYARRVTTLKHFFSYLKTLDVITHDPAAAVIQRPVRSALPVTLLDGEIERVLAVTERIRTDVSSPDARPHMLVLLVLGTGIKKSEVMNIRPDDILIREPDPPQLWVKYASPKMRYKERKVALDPAWLPVYEEYMAQRQPPDTLFDCTPRNLEYVLRDVAAAASLPRRKLSFESLRWTSAIRDYEGGMDPDKLREKMGLSRISWRETSAKLAELKEQRKGD